MLLKSKSYRSKPRIEIYCGECLDGSIPEPMVITEKSNDMRARTYRCKRCNKSVTLVVTQETIDESA